MSNKKHLLLLMRFRGTCRVPLYKSKLAPHVSGDVNYPACSFIYYTDVRSVSISYLTRGSRVVLLMTL